MSTLSPFENTLDLTANSAGVLTIVITLFSSTLESAVISVVFTSSKLSFLKLFTKSATSLEIPDKLGNRFCIANLSCSFSIKLLLFAKPVKLMM